MVDTDRWKPSTRPLGADWTLDQKLAWLEEVTELMAALRPIPAPTVPTAEARSGPAAADNDRETG